MRIWRILQTLFFLVLTGSVSLSCKAQSIDELDNGRLEPVEFRADSKVKAVIMTGTGMENRYQGRGGQGMAIHDRIMYRLYDTGLCQTFDLSDLAYPKKIASFELGSHASSNHAIAPRPVSMKMETSSSMFRGKRMEGPTSSG